MLLDGVAGRRGRLRRAAAAGRPRLPDARAAAVRGVGAGGRGLRPAPPGLAARPTSPRRSTRRSSSSACRRTVRRAAPLRALRRRAAAPGARRRARHAAAPAAAGRAVREPRPGDAPRAGRRSSRGCERTASPSCWPPTTSTSPGRSATSCWCSTPAAWRRPAPGTSARPAASCSRASRLREPFLVRALAAPRPRPRRGAAHGGGGRRRRCDEAGDRPVLPRRRRSSTGWTRAPSSSPSRRWPIALFVRDSFAGLAVFAAAGVVAYVLSGVPRGLVLARLPAAPLAGRAHLPGAGAVRPGRALLQLLDLPLLVGRAASSPRSSACGWWCWCSSARC